MQFTYSKYIFSIPFLHGVAILMTIRVYNCVKITIIFIITYKFVEIYITIKNHYKKLAIDGIICQNSKRG